MHRTGVGLLIRDSKRGIDMPHFLSLTNLSHSPLRSRLFLSRTRKMRFDKVGQGELRTLPQPTPENC